MLIEKEIIGPGCYWYSDQETGLPRKLEVTPELTRYWYEQGSKMLSAGLTIPVPCEHDFDAHPMTPAEKLKNNAGWVKEYRLKDGNKLFGVCDIQDQDIAKKLPHTIRWTSPWINSFTDGNGNQWNNVISHLALTTRPRITKQAPFPSIAAALSMAADVVIDPATPTSLKGGLCLSKAGKLVARKKDKRLRPQYPIAFSLYSGGIPLAFGDDMKSLSDDGGDAPEKPKKKKSGDSGDKSKSSGKDSGGGGDGGNSKGDEVDSPDGSDDIDGGSDDMGMESFRDPVGDVSMEELLCDLLGALGIHCEKTGNDEHFKRSLYNAAMSKIHELTAKAQASGPAGAQNAAGNTTSPSGPGNQGNPLIQQEQQPMYMSLEDINKITDPTMKSIALSMYNENVKLRAEMEANAKTANSLRDAKLKEATAQRNNRIAMLSKLSPKVKADLEAMVASPSMALSMGEGGAVNDPMAQTLAVLEKGLADMPRLLTTESSALSVQPQPTDGEMSADEIDKLADNFARMMGCPPEKKAS